MLELNLILAVMLKPSVIIIGILLLRPFWYLRQKPGLLIMFWSTVCFLIGEIACALDVYIMHKMTLVNEGLHDIFMLISFVGYSYGIYKIFLAKYGCFKNDCKKYNNCELDAEICEKNQQFGLYPIWLFIAGIILSIFPLFATQVILQTSLPAGYGETVIGSYLYDRTFDLYVLQQIIFPISAIIAFSINVVLYIFNHKMKPLLWKISCYGIGALGFVYFRLILINIFHPNVVYTAIGEEILELMFMLLLILWIAPKYRRNLKT
jgi:hypothetical protein